MRTMIFKKKWLLLFLIACTQLFTSCTNNAADSPYPPLQFTKVTEMPGSGRASAIAFSINGKGYIALGRDALGNTLKDCWEFNPQLDTVWNKKTEFPGIARVKAMAAVVNGKAYIGLGYDPSKTNGMDNVLGSLKDFWTFDPTRIDSWTKNADYPSTATDACVTFVHNSDIYVAAGFNGLGFTNEVWKYNTLNDSWLRIKDFPGVHRAVAIACADSAHIYFGTGYKTMSLNDWWEYEPSTDSWTQKKPMPDSGRGNAVAFTINNRYFVATGRHFGGDLTGGHVKSDIMEYDPQRNVWYNRGDLPASGRENAMVFVLNGKGYIGLGENNTNLLNDLWCFIP